MIWFDPALCELVKFRQGDFQLFKVSPTGIGNSHAAFPFIGLLLGILHILLVIFLRILSMGRKAESVVRA